MNKKALYHIWRTFQYGNPPFGEKVLSGIETSKGFVSIIRMMQILKKMNHSFEEDRVIYWSNLARTNNLLIILNISLFFVTELVTREGYYYTYYSLGFLSATVLGCLLPLGLTRRLLYYCMFLVFELAAMYFLTSSIWYWVVTQQI